MQEVGLGSSDSTRHESGNLWSEKESRSADEKNERRHYPADYRSSTNVAVLNRVHVAQGNDALPGEESENQDEGMHTAGRGTELGAREGACRIVSHAAAQEKLDTRSIVPPLNLSRLARMPPRQVHQGRSDRAEQHQGSAWIGSSGALDWYHPVPDLAFCQQENSSNRAAARTNSMQSKVGSQASRRTISGRTWSMQSSFNRSEASDASTRRGSFYDSVRHNFPLMLQEEIGERSRGNDTTALMHNDGQDTSWRNESSLDYFDFDDDDADDGPAAETNLSSWTNGDMSVVGSGGRHDSTATAYRSVSDAAACDTAEATATSLGEDGGSSPAEKLRLAADAGCDMIVCADIGEPTRDRRWRRLLLWRAPYSE